MRSAREWLMTARETARRHALAWRAEICHAARMSVTLRHHRTAFPQFRYYQGASREQAGFGPRPIRRGGGRCRFLGPVHALPATPARAVGKGLRLGGRCRRDVVLEPLSRGSL